MRDRVVNPFDHHSLRDQAEDVQCNKGLTPHCVVLPLIPVAEALQSPCLVESQPSEHLHDHVVDEDEHLEPEVPLHHPLERRL